MLVTVGEIYLHFFHLDVTAPFSCSAPLYKKLAGSASEAPSSDDMMGSKLHLRGAKEEHFIAAEAFAVLWMKST